MKQLLLVFSFIFSVYFSFAQSQWNQDTLVRNAVCTADHLQYEPQMCSDGSKGAIIAWADQRIINSQQIYAQRIDSNGVNQWVTNGVLLNMVADASIANAPVIVADNVGGAIIFYTVIVSGIDNIYAQKLDHNGIAQWGMYGIPIDTLQASHIQSNENAANNIAAPDGLGGAYFTWQQSDPFNIYAQHLDKDGNFYWGANGVSITVTDSINSGDESYIINTGGGTAVVGYTYGSHLYLQRVANDGSFMWGGTGTLVADSAEDIAQPIAYLTFDSVSVPNSVLLSWVDIRNYTADVEDLYAQKIDLSGNPLWQFKGIPIASSASDEYNPDMVIDKSGGFFIVYDSASNTKVQHVNGTGQLLWGATGTSTNVGNYIQEDPVIADDGNGGVIAMWHDERLNPSEAIYAQHFDGNGITLWRPDGVPVIVGSPSIDHSVNPILSLEDGTAIAVWSDGRSGTNANDIYAAKFSGIDSIIPVQLLAFTATLVNGQTQLHWATADELNSKYFEVQRSPDAVNFTKLATVAAHGNSSAYSTTDATPFNGFTYYRLKYVDINGSFTYSQVVNVKTASLLALYPNPVKSALHIDGLPTSATTLSIIDFSGRILQQATATGNNYSLNVQQLPAGNYYLKTSTDKEVNTLKFTKQ
jgi:hypothetical protein